MVGRCWEGWLLRDFQPHKMGHNLSRNVSYMIIYLGIYALGIWLIMTHKFINDWLWLLSKFQPKNWRDVIDSYSLEGGLFVVVVVYPAIYRVNVCHFFVASSGRALPPNKMMNDVLTSIIQVPKIVQIKQGLIPLGKPILVVSSLETGCLEDWFGRMGMTLSSWLQLQVGKVREAHNVIGQSVMHPLCRLL